MAQDQDSKQEVEILTEDEKKRLFGKRPPRIPLATTIGYLDELVKLGGGSGTADDLSRAVSSNAPKGGTYEVRSGSLRNLDLIKMNDRSTYVLLPLGSQITSGIAELRKEAIRKAFLVTPTVRKIWDTYKAGLLPATAESFGNNLVLRLPDDIPNIAGNPKNWAEYFLQGARFCEFVEERTNGLYLLSKEPDPEAIASGEEREDAGKNRSTGIMRHEEQQSLNTVYAHPSDLVSYSRMLSSGRMLSITLPEDPTPNEAAEIVARAKFVIRSMKGFMEAE